MRVFDGLKNLIILDQLKKKVSSDARNHFIDVWCDWLTPEELVEKMDSYDNLRIRKGNRTLLGADLLRTAGIVLNLQKGQWFFSGTPHQQYNFAAPPPDIKSLLVMLPVNHPCQLRKNEGAHLSRQQLIELIYHLQNYEKCFQPGVGPTPFVDHRINTGNHLPVHVPHYRTSPVLKHFGMTCTSPLRPLRKCDRPPRKTRQLVFHRSLLVPPRDVPVEIRGGTRMPMQISFLPVPSSEQIKDSREDIPENSSATGGAENSVLDDKDKEKDD
ncbi:uncharacterized protein CEXT_529161 [Caerostris extrusa]|uniref:Uncharacterized protein n=1 Tax=Caerostris extrusa TaxID=172846 RepID=A0AAV4VEC4_CAEEX|nr:uncharacterized protein CEXT_529161 [Caerostris extrusa]